MVRPEKIATAGFLNIRGLSEALNQNNVKRDLHFKIISHIPVNSYTKKEMIFSRIFI